VQQGRGLVAYRDATPVPKLVVGDGGCDGCDGSIFGASCAACGRVANVIPVDVAVPVCPPPLEKLCGILTAVRCCRAPSAEGVTA